MWFLKMLLLVMVLFFCQSFAQVMVIHRSGALLDTSIQVSDIAKIKFNMTVPPIIADGSNLSPGITKILSYGPLVTSVEYSIESVSIVKIRVYDIHGRVVRTLNDRKMNAGHYTSIWNSCNEAGNRVGSSLYIVNIKIDNKSISKSLFVAN